MKGHNKIFILEIILFISLLFNSFVFKIANTYMIFGITLMALAIMFFMVGFEKDNFRYKKDVLLNISIILLIYFFVTYFLGFFFGFTKTSYSLSFINIVKNTFPVILLVISSELLRYSIVSKTKEDKKSIFLAFLIFVVIDVNTMVHIYDVTTNAGLMKMICLVIFPSATKNVFLIYLTQKVGYKSCIFYNIIMELTVYLLPIFPDFGEYLNILLKTILPIIMMTKISNMFNYNEERKIVSSRYNNKKMILYSIITFILFLIVMLTSGYFKYFAVTIGSGSMSPKIEKGDIVIVKKMNASEVKKGDILVYNHENRMIVHRVKKILKIESKIYFITKGDSNNANDSYTIKEEDVVGITSLRIKYLGMPTVALNELLDK